MKKAIFIVGIMLLGITLVFSACSKDKKINSIKIEGDYNNPQFREAQDLTEGFIDTMLTGANDGFSYVNFDGGTRIFGPTSDSIAISFDDSTYWWTIFIMSDTTTASLTILDSVRFEDANGYQRLPDSTTTTAIDYRQFAGFSLIGDSLDLNAVFERNFHLSGIQAEQVVFNMGSTANIVLTAGQSSYQRVYGGHANALTFLRSDLENEPRPHPQSGEIGVTMNIQTETPDGSASVSWVVTVTFFVDHYHVYVESGDNFWEWDVQYPG